MRYYTDPFTRSAFAFDPFAALFATAHDADGDAYDLERVDDDHYRLVVAAPGYGENDLDITQQQNALVIKGAALEDSSEATTVVRGLGRGAFERRFVLADNVRVVGAETANGLIRIRLERVVPEELRPRRIEIGRAGDTPALAS